MACQKVFSTTGSPHKMYRPNEYTTARWESKTSMALGGYESIQEVVQCLQRCACTMLTEHEHFGGDAEGNFFGRLGSQVQANRRMHLLQAFTRHPFAKQVTEDVLDLARAANHANIAGRGFEGGTQGILVEVMAACDDDDPAGLVGF